MWKTYMLLSLTHCIFSRIINGHYHKPPFRRQHLRGKFLILNSLFHLKVCWCCIWSLFRSFDNFYIFLLSRIRVTILYSLGQKKYTFLLQSSVMRTTNFASRSSENGHLFLLNVTTSDISANER